MRQKPNRHRKTRSADLVAADACVPPLLEFDEPGDAANGWGTLSELLSREIGRRKVS